MIKGIRHFGIVVNNIDKALKFYCSGLDFKIIKQDILSEIETERFLNICSKLTYIKLALNGNLSTCIELYYFHTKQSITKNSFHHIALTTDNIDKLYKNLTSIGISFNYKPIFDKEKKHKLCFCKDYDGNIIELVEVL